MIDVALVSNSELIAYGLRAVLGKTDDTSLVCVANSLSDYIAEYKDEKHKVIIVDIQAIRFPEAQDAQSFVDDFHNLSADSGIIILTYWSNRYRFEFSRYLGVRGYCLKTINNDDLIEAIKTVADGDIYIHDDYREQFKINEGSLCFFNKLDNLFGKRQMEVLNLVVLGYTNDEIADSLHISLPTVKSHMRTILKKLNARDRTQAMSHILKDMSKLLGRNTYIGE